MFRSAQRPTLQFVLEIMLDAKLFSTTSRTSTRTTTRSIEADLCARFEQRRIRAAWWSIRFELNIRTKDDSEAGWDEKWYVAGSAFRCQI